MIKAILLVLITCQAFAQTPFKRFNSIDDKTKHMVVSTSIAIPATIVAWKITNRQGLSTLIGFLTALTVGAGKELIYDKAMHRGKPSWSDFAHDGLGSAYGAMGGTMTIGVAKHMKEVEEDKFRDLGVPSILIK